MEFLEGNTHFICYPDCMRLWCWCIVLDSHDSIKSNDCHLHSFSPIRYHKGCKKVRVWVQPIGMSLLYAQYAGVCCKVEPYCIVRCRTSYLMFFVKDIQWQYFKVLAISTARLIYTSYTKKWTSSSEMPLVTSKISLKINSCNPVGPIPMVGVSADTNLTTRLGCLINTILITLKNNVCFLI